MQKIQDIQKAVFACVDGSKFSEAVCEYGVDIAKQLSLPLVLLNTLDHPKTSEATNLSGNLILGEREDLLDSLSNEDATKNKESRIQSKELLAALKEKINTQGFENVITLQRHGTLYENLKDLQPQLRVVLFGVSDTKNSQSEDIIRDVDAPIILVNKEFTPIKRVMIAFNGTSGSLRALEEISGSPMLAKDVERYIVTINKDIQKAQDLINQAKRVLKDSSLDYTYIFKAGDPLENILECIDKNNIDIISIGSYSHGKLKTALFGSFTTKLIKNVQIPMIVLK